MKKVVLSIIFCLFLCIPAFSATTNISTAQLNKQGWEYLKQNKYSKAFDSFSEIYKYAKTQEDYGYIIYGYLEFIKNDDLSAKARIKLCRQLMNTVESKITDNKLKDVSNAIMFKLINIIAKTDENDEIFTTLYKKNKNELLKEYHDYYTNAVETLRGSYDSLLMFACYEYAIGNRFLGMRMFEHVGNAKHKHPAISKQYGDKEDLSNLINLVMDICD